MQGGTLEPIHEQWLRALSARQPDPRDATTLRLLADYVDRAVRGCRGCGSLGPGRWAGERPEIWFCDRCYAELKEHFYVEAAGPMVQPKNYRRPTAHGGIIYFAKLPTGHIKIGVTVKLKQRMNALDADCLATEHGGLSREAELHKMFGHLRVRPDREWFEPAPDLMTYIAARAVEPRTDNGTPLLPFRRLPAQEEAAA